MVRQPAGQSHCKPRPVMLARQNQWLSFCRTQPCTVAVLHNPNLSVSGVHLHMTSSTEATSTPKVAVNDIGSEEAFLAAIDETIKYFNDGDIVEGTVVKVDRDEV